MLRSIKYTKLNKEMIATLVFVVISALYILTKFGTEQLFDTLFLWMFPASIMIFLTLVMVKILERAYKRRRGKSQKYVEIKIN